QPTFYNTRTQAANPLTCPARNSEYHSLWLSRLDEDLSNRNSHTTWVQRRLHQSRRAPLWAKQYLVCLVPVTMQSSWHSHPSNSASTFPRGNALSRRYDLQMPIDRVSRENQHRSARQSRLTQRDAG